jgi:hypothetical protein
VAYGAPAAALFEFFWDQEKNEKTAWFSVLVPKMKAYPDTPQPDYILTSFGTKGLSNWLVQHQLSQKVRLYFSGIDGNLLHPFLECVGVNVSMGEQYAICHHLESLLIFPFFIVVGYFTLFLSVLV